MHLNAFAGLSCAFILPFFDLTCYTSVYRMNALITFLYKTRTDYAHKNSCTTVRNESISLLISACNNDSCFFPVISRFIPMGSSSYHLVQGVFVLVHGVFVLVHEVFVLVHGVFVLVEGIFVLVHGVLGLRSLF